MDYLDDDEFAPRPAPSKPNPAIIVALLAGAGAAVLLLWMTLGLSSRVASLEDSIANLQKTISEQNQSKEVADLTNQMDSVTQALSNHLKSQAANRTEGQNDFSMNQPDAIRSHVAPSRAPAPRSLPIQPIPGGNAPGAQNDRNYNNAPQPSGNFNAYNSGSLPPPVSRVDIAPIQNRFQNSSSGGWVVNITSVSDSESAYQEVERLRGMGISAESARAVSNGRTWYRIRIPGFNSHDEASNARSSLEARLGVRDTWVGQRD